MNYQKPSFQNIVYVAYIQTPIGQMLAVVDETYLYILTFADQNNIQQLLQRLTNLLDCIILEQKANLHNKVQQELDLYFNHKLEIFTIPLQPTGTQFQKCAWQALSQIPYGTTTSYNKQAAVAGNPKAYRAVANANKNNPIAIIIPCHRVIKSNGDLCGYNGGIENKKALLSLEQSNIKSI